MPSQSTFPAQQNEPREISCSETEYKEDLEKRIACTRKELAYGLDLNCDEIKLYEAAKSEAMFPLESITPAESPIENTQTVA